MAGYITDQQQNTGSYIPTTQVWNISEVLAANLDPKLEELFVRMYQNLGLMSDVLNSKEWAFYLTQELVNSQSFFNTTTNDQQTLRPVYRTVIDFGALNGPIVPGLNQQPHGLTIATTWNFTNIYGVANDNTGKNYYPLVGGDGSNTGDVEIYVDATNININNNTAITFSNCYVVLEYLKY